ncbi:MAG TPA: amidase family protein [Solirubrobacteraceae bacterium]|nr:amidase family protein [Solirubrobacteraceae bacterium]
MTAGVADDVETAFAGPGALARLVGERQVSPRELVELFLARIDALDPRLNAFRVTLAEQALAEADELDAARAAGPLAGVPIAIKDDIPLAGQIATKGTRVLAEYGARAPVDAEPIRRLRVAGAIPIGITNVPELTVFPWTATTANGITRNPWDPSRTPGGSSGGSAAAIASGMAPAATASDGGGSIRIPAACCGLVGMKPTRGRVPSGPGSSDPSSGWLGLAGPGALARTVADSALLLDVIHGPAPGGDPGTLPRHEGSYKRAAATDPPPLRIAISCKVPFGVVARVGRSQRDAVDSTAGLFEQLGHSVEPCDPDYGLAQLEFVQAWFRGVYEEAASTGRRNELERPTRQMAAAGRYLIAPPVKRRLLRVRPRTSARIMALWDRFDVLITPGLARAPVAAEGALERSAPIAIDLAARMTPFTAIFNLTGQAAISVPAGFDDDGLPLAVQLVGRLGAEDVLYALAGQLERARPWAQHRPPIA